MTLWPYLAVDFLIVAALAGLGAALVRVTLGKADAWATVSLAFPVGAGAFTWLLFLLSWAHVRLGAATIVATYVGALALPGALLAYRRSRRRSGALSWNAAASHAAAWSQPIADPDAEPTPWQAATPGSASRSPEFAMAGLLLLFLAGAGPLALLRAHSQWDATAGWIVKGYGIALQGDIRAGAIWGAWKLAYPLNIPLQTVFFRVFSGDQLPGSMLAFPLYAASLAAGLFRFWRRHEVGGWQAWVGVVVLLTNPLILLHATIAYANLPTTTYVVLATCWLIEGLNRKSPAGVTMASLLFGLAGWTRAEAVSYGLFIVPAVLLLHRLLTRQRTPIVRAVLPFGILEGAWFLFGWSAVNESHLGQAVRGVWPKLQAGDFRLFELYLIPRLLAERAIDPRIWGLLFPLAGVLCLVGLRTLLTRPLHFTPLSWLSATAIAAAIPIGIFYVRAFTRGSDFIPFLNRSFDRAFLPAAVMLLALGFLLAFGARTIGARSRPGGA